MLKILGRDNSANVMKVLWCCGELGLPFDREDYGGQFGKTKDAAYLEMNPNALVPTVIDDGFVMWESNTIIRYLGAKHDAGGLYPTDLRERATGEKWMDWQLSVVTGVMVPVFWGLIRTKEEDRDMAQINAARDRWAHAFSMLDTFLGRTEFVAGSRFTVCDIPVGVMAYRWFNLPIEREDYPNLKRWYDALCQRKPYQDYIMKPLS